MKFNTNQVIKNTNGDNLKKDDKDLTIGQLITDILFSMSKEQSIAYRIGMLIINSKTSELELPAEDVVFIKKAMEDAGTFAYVYGQVVEALEK